MTLSTYADLQSAITNWLGGRTDLTTYYPDWITLFEAVAARKLRLRPMETTTILVPSNPTAVTITGAADNGSGLIRLTVSSTTTLTTGTEYVVSSVNGTTEANGAWIITVISSTTLDLQSSTFTNTYVGGGSIQGIKGKATLPTDYLAVRRVTSTGNPRIDLTYLEPSLFQTYYPTIQTNTLNSNSPQSYTIEGGYLFVSGTPGTSLEFDYYAKTAAISGSLNWLWTAHPDVYLWGSLAEAGGFVDDPNQIAMWKSRRDEVFDEIKMVDFRERPGSMAVRPMGYTP